MNAYTELTMYEQREMIKTDAFMKNRFYSLFFAAIEIKMFGLTLDATFGAYLK